MKKSQYHTFGFIFFFCGVYLLFYGVPFAISQDSMVGAIKSGLYGVFGQSFIILSFAFFICGWLQDK